MRTRIYAGFGLAVMIAMVVAAIIVTNPLSTEAAVDDNDIASASQTEVSSRTDAIGVEHVTQPDGMGQLQATADTDSEAKPYIGVVIYLLEDGTVKVVKVLPDSPSDGILEAGDTITAVNGVAIGGVSDLTDAIETAGVGGSLALAVVRDGSDMDVSVTVGEWTKKARGNKGMFHKPSRMKGRIASSQFMIADEDGNYSTYRRVFGSVTDLDTDAGTFTLQPKDGSNPIEYTINEDTRIFVGKDRADDLSGLDTDEEMVVMDVDGEVKVVKQAGEDVLGGFDYRNFGMHKFWPGGASYHRFFFMPLSGSR